MDYGVVWGGLAGILNACSQLLHLTTVPRVVSGTTMMWWQFEFGHMIRILLAAAAEVDSVAAADFAAASKCDTSGVGLG